MVDCPPLLLDGLHGDIAHKENGAAVYRPHIVQGVRLTDVMVEQDVAPGEKAVIHLCLYISILYAVGPVKIRQVQMPGASHAHALGLQDKALAL